MPIEKRYEPLCYGTMGGNHEWLFIAIACNVVALWLVSDECDVINSCTLPL